MPILDVQVVTDELSNAEKWPQEMADAAGTVFRRGEGQVWVKLHIVNPSRYAENHIPKYSTPRPVFVRVTCFELPDEVELEVQTRSLADRFSEILDVPPSWIHMLYDPPAKGRVAFGGELRCE